MGKLCLLVFILLVADAYSFVFNVSPRPDPEHPGKCVYGGHVMKPKESYQPPNKCIVVTCAADLSISGRGCGVTVASEGCRIVERDPSAKYPDCCDTTVCGENGSISKDDEE